MIITDRNTTMYMTRQHYGTSIVMDLHYRDGSTLTGVSFREGKIRESIEIPENKEDKKIWMVISAIRELIDTNELKELNVTVYEKNILVSYKDSEEALFRKIKDALLDYVEIDASSCEAVVYDVRKSIEKGLMNGEIDVF